jgi:quercetin dioxygenase-like cupin family protein
MTVKIVRPTDRALQPVSADVAPGASADIKARSARQVVSETDPYVQFTKIQAGTSVPAHSHAAPEAMVILSGTANVGGQVCEAGTLLIIPANEEYGFDVGPNDDLTFVVVRPESGGFTAGRS